MRPWGIHRTALGSTKIQYCVLQVACHCAQQDRRQRGGGQGGQLRMPVLPRAVVCIFSGCALGEYIQLHEVVQIQYTLDIHMVQPTITYTRIICIPNYKILYTPECKVFYNYGIFIPLNKTKVHFVFRQDHNHTAHVYICMHACMIPPVCLAMWEANKFV